MLKVGKFDSTIVVSAGAHNNKFPIKGIDNKNVFFATDVLRNPDLMKDFTDIAAGVGGVVGAETTYMLTYEFNKKPFVIEMDSYIINYVCTTNRGHIIHYLEEKNIALYNMAKCVEMNENSNIISQNIHKNVPNPYLTRNRFLPENIQNPLAKKPKDIYKTKELNSDAIILALCVTPHNKLYFNLVTQNIAHEINLIGDAFKSAKVHQATSSVYRKTRST